MNEWTLFCSACGHLEAQHAEVGVCPLCGQPFFAKYADPRPERSRIRGHRWDMWRYAPALPLLDGEDPVTLGEGATPLVELPRLAREVGVGQLFVKDEGKNPTASFKARGLAAAVTRARARGVPGLVVPTAGNAGAALAAYGARAGLPVRVYAPVTTPAPILATIRALGADLVTVEGHIGDAGRLATDFARESGFFNVATLREPYRVEGNKTLGIELAEQLGWAFPDVIVYPTGGGEGVVGIWKAVLEMRDWGWIDPSVRLPKLVVAQAAGCAPLVRAWKAAAETALPWENPRTSAAGLRVPAPLGDRLVLKALRESAGIAAAVDEEQIAAATKWLATNSGIDACPEGGCALAVLAELVREGAVAANACVVVFNTGSGASYRSF